MEENVYLDKLERRDIKPTAIRLLILKNMLEVGRAVSLLDLETLLDTVDKSTISRTMTKKPLPCWPRARPRACSSWNRRV